MNDKECDRKPQPCKNSATCNDAINDYQCACPAGFTGFKCQHDIDECASSPCKYGATCTNLVNKYVCNCTEGYKGINCETNINDCTPNPCDTTGTVVSGCDDKVDDFECRCKPGYKGKNCSVSIAIQKFSHPSHVYLCVSGTVCPSYFHKATMFKGGFPRQKSMVQEQYKSPKFINEISKY